MISSLIAGVGSRVPIDQLGNYLVFALKNADDDCIRLACGIVSDLSLALKEGMSQYLNDFVPPIITVLRDDQMERMSKLQSIHALGDLALHVGSPFLK